MTTALTRHLTSLVDPKLADVLEPLEFADDRELGLWALRESLFRLGYLSMPRGQEIAPAQDQDVEFSQDKVDEMGKAKQRRLAPPRAPKLPTDDAAARATGKIAPRPSPIVDNALPRCPICSCDLTNQPTAKYTNRAPQCLQCPAPRFSHVELFEPPSPSQVIEPTRPDYSDEYSYARNNLSVVLHYKLNPWGSGGPR